MQQWQTCSLKDGVDECVSLYSAFLLMTAVIQFNTAHWTHCRRITQNKVDVLAVNPSLRSPVLIWPSHKEQIPEIHFRTNHILRTHGFSQHVTERKFRSRQKVIPLTIRQNFLDRLPADRKTQHLQNAAQTSNRFRIHS